ncbi:hypothetical protein [Nocardiopsis tropica]|uniref:Uncharacterized protein n=1 Tax=Nocardiopsis tropica TaxID=109330 RepID=A0ABU7KXQ1_9ACTN|nr:hypothetical protein [Nocardiopsis umidischolae]MEE2054081.1 hypothetical protein [Nocardiopsis umidischolae]
MSTTRRECPLHGAGADPARLVGRRVRQVMAAWHARADRGATDPVEVWLVDDLGDAIHLTTGSDWCLVVDDAAPHSGYGMGGYGSVEVAPWTHGSPFVPHAGEPVVAVHERFDSETGRVGLKIVFPTGSVEYESWSGDLRSVG